jgi:hypothetical protein
MARFEKGKPRPKGAGRKKGTPNELTKTVKETVLAVFNELQEDINHPAHLSNFAKKNPKEFYVIASKLIPAEVNANMHLIKVGRDATDELYEDKE